LSVAGRAGKASKSAASLVAKNGGSGATQEAVFDLGTRVLKIFYQAGL
jgi:hypothetical protein